jgi:PadR family transcriptional regulator, regulatory protein PadR
VLDIRRQALEQAKDRSETGGAPRKRATLAFLRDICQTSSMRTTHALVQLAAALMAAPEDRHWGYQLSKASGVRSGAMYPRLTSMLEEGWLSDGWETQKEASGRPPRRYYRLTEKGKVELGAILARAQQDQRFRGLNLGFA